MMRPTFCPNCYAVTHEEPPRSSKCSCGGTHRRLWVQEANRYCGQWVTMTGEGDDPFDSDEVQAEFAKVKHLFPRYENENINV